MRPDDALILIDHGSRLDEANRLLEGVAAKLGAEGGFAIVEIAHMELAPPTLADAIDRAAARGARRVVITPYFLASGRHATDDIPRLAAEAASRHPSLPWILAEPLGLDDRLAQIVRDRAKAGLTQLEVDAGRNERQA